MTPFIIGVSIVALVLLVAALTSRIVERAPLSFPIIFLGVGFVIGGGGLGIIEVDARSPLLEAVSTISLALVLFLDAVKVQIDELRREWFIPVLTLGPGTLITILGGAAVSYVLLGLLPLEALLLGAILASTDPVVLRDIIRDPRLPRSVRRALSIEAGMNDIVVLPIVLVLTALLAGRVGEPADWIGFLFSILVLSPIIGLVIGGVGAWVIDKFDARFKISEQYLALYGIGLVLASFAGAQALGGTGFVAAFFAGLAISLFSISLCECFLDYGETTSEMLMLLAFVLFGVVLSDLLGTIDLAAPLVLALITLFVIRPGAFALVLQRARMSGMARGFIGWFGPRGLSSLLLALLVVQAGAPNADTLLAITGVVVLVSVIVHGVSATPTAEWYARRVARETLEEERESTFVGLLKDAPDDIDMLLPVDLADRLSADPSIIVLDVRSRSHYDTEDGQIPGSVRVPPDQVGDWAADFSGSKDTLIVAYCSCPNDATSARVARQLRSDGFSNSAALIGGYPAWRDAHPVEPKAMILLSAIE